MRILAINPGATSTKVAVYDDEEPVFVESIRHEAEELAKFDHTYDQYEFRAKTIRDAIEKYNVNIETLDAVVGRGGPFKPLVSGTYRVNFAMKADVKQGNVQADHISNIGCLLADEIATPLGIPAYIVDPVSVDEFDDVAYVSGMKELPRISLAHSLNIKMVAKRHASKMGARYDDLNLVIVHLGGGISITAHRKGRQIDANNANDGGPFSPQRTGSLPVTGLVKLCYSGEYTERDMLKKLIKAGGMLSLVGTDNMIEVVEKANTDAHFDLVLRAFVYQVGKSIGEYSAALKGDVDAILITGGIAQNEPVMDMIREYVDWIAPIYVYPGEDEMEGLVMGVLRVVNGEEEEKEYD
jgi:butyrate kinase